MASKLGKSDSTLSELNKLRQQHKNITWLSSSGICTPITKLSDDYLLNVMRSVGSKIALLKLYPGIPEFETYNNVRYSEYRIFLMNEYLYRQAALEERCNTLPVDDYSDNWESN